jgi:hypothetical protein
MSDKGCEHSWPSPIFQFYSGSSCWMRRRDWDWGIGCPSIEEEEAAAIPLDRERADAAAALAADPCLSSATPSSSSSGMTASAT